MSESGYAVPTSQRTPNAVPRTAFVTGASKRVGRAIALKLAHAGWNIAVHYGRSIDEAEEVADLARKAGVQAATLQGDLTIEDQVTPLIDLATAALGPVGLLVNNASIFEPDRLHSVSRASWDKHMEANLRAPVVLMQSFARALPAESDGVIVNILDQRVRNPTEDFLSYTLTKNALWGLTRSLALDLAPRIRVNGIGPGPILPSVHQSTELFERQAASTPLQHGSDPDEIADGVLYLSTAKSVTGQMIAVDGGQHLWWAPPGQDTPGDS
ncbi:MAG: SDR family oxidoreductase [Alphaproteobacteria bacterium]|nr:SDR family oxidoreductase [Alphaproteobacteria bacterium]